MIDPLPITTIKYLTPEETEQKHIIPASLQQRVEKGKPLQIKDVVLDKG